MDYALGLLFADRPLSIDNVAFSVERLPSTVIVAVAEVVAEVCSEKCEIILIKF